MTSLDSKVKFFGNIFTSRLDNELLQYAIGYVDYGETNLAFEIICDHLSEYEVKINHAEYDLAITLCNELGMNVNDISVRYLKELIVCEK